MATTTTKKFEMNFKTGNGKTKKIALTHPKDGISREVAEAAMDTLVTKQIFEKEQVDQYAKANGANYVIRTVEEVVPATVK